METLFFLHLIFALLFNNVFGESSSENVLRELHSKFAKYNKELRPSIGEKAVKVFVSLYINSVQQIDTQDMGLTVDLTLTQRWNDSRLEFTESDSISEVGFGISKMDEIWMPDTYFRDQRNEYTQRSDSNSKLKIERNGQVKVTQRMRVELSCPMDFSSYPLDYQKCWLVLGSFSHTFDDIQYEWEAEDPNSSDIPVPHPSYYSLGHMLMETPTPLYSQITLILRFARTASPSVKTIFLPSFCLFLISWLSLLLPKTQITGRLLLAVGALLGLLFLPSQHFFPVWTAGDIFIGACATLAIGCLSVTIFSSWDEKNEQEEAENKIKLGMSKLDFFSLVVTGIVFLLFNIVFWSIYGGGHQRPQEITVTL